MNNATTCMSSLNVSGNTTLNSGELTVGNNNSFPNLQLGSTNGNNLAITTTAGSFSTGANAGDMVLRSINRLLLLSGITGYGIMIDANNYVYFNKLLSLNIDNVDRSVVENRIFTSGGVLTGVFGGDVIVTSYWGVAINLNNGGFTNGIGGANNTRSHESGYSAFTINMRSSTTQTTFDRRLFTVMPDGKTTINGVLSLKNDVWHLTNDNIYRFYFSPNSTTFICSGGAATDNGFIVYSSGASGGYNVNLGILNNGNTTIRGTLNSGALTSGNISCPGITCTSAVTAIYVNGGGKSIFTGSVGISNISPWAP